MIITRIYIEILNSDYHYLLRRKIMKITMDRNLVVTKVVNDVSNDVGLMDDFHQELELQMKILEEQHQKVEELVKIEYYSIANDFVKFYKKWLKGKISDKDMYNINRRWTEIQNRVEDLDIILT